MNDTHPAISVAELMRLLVDEHSMEWDAAWNVTQRTLSYTNHTLLPEALEQWPRGLFGSLLPRHLEIVDEINRRHLEDVRKKFPGDGERVARLSLIDENGEKYVRMAHLAALGSHAINGVAALHTELLKTNVLRDFYELTPAEVLQQDQRRHAAPLDGSGQSRPYPTAHCAPGHRLDSRSGEAAPA